MPRAAKGGNRNPPNSKQLEELYLLRQQEWETTRQLALSSTYWMATLVLWPDVAAKHYWEPAHKPEQDWLDATPRGGKRVLRIHRQGRKTMFNVARCVRLICLDPNIRIMVVSSYQRTAIDMCALVKRQFTMNESFKKFFPSFAVDDPKFGKIDEFTHPARTLVSLLDPTLFATYLGAPLISRRCDIWVGDDPVDEKMVANPDVAQTTMTQFIQSIPLVDETSDYRQRLFIGTPKSYNDPLAAITEGSASSELKVEGESIRGWETLTRPIAYLPNGDFLSGGEFCFPDENPDAMIHLPNVHTKKRIREIFYECKDDAARGEGYFFREYGMLVQAPGDQKFLPEWLDTWIEPQQVPLNTVFSGIAVDSAIKDDQILFRGDNMVILIGHFDQYGRLYLTDAARSRGWKTEDFRRFLLTMAANPKNRQPENFIREKVGEGGMFPLVRGWFNESRRPIVTHPLKVIGQGKKYLRITEALQGPLMGRKIFFVKGQFPEDIHKVLVDELIHLGQWGHDDVADALALFFHPDIRVIPESRLRSRPWTDVVSRPAQISTSWTNTAALQQFSPQSKSPNERSFRLTPWGQDISLDTETFMVEGSGPREMPDESPFTPQVVRTGGKT